MRFIVLKWRKIIWPWQMMVFTKADAQDQVFREWLNRLKTNCSVPRTSRTDKRTDYFCEYAKSKINMQVSESKRSQTMWLENAWKYR